MKRYVVSGVLISTLLVPVTQVLAKTDANSVNVGALATLPSEVSQGSVNAGDSPDDQLFTLATLPIRDDEADLKESHPIWKFWEDDEEGEGFWPSL